MEAGNIFIVKTWQVETAKDKKGAFTSLELRKTLMSYDATVNERAHIQEIRQKTVK